MQGVGGRGGEGKGGMGAWASKFFLFNGSSSNLPEYNNWTRHVTGAADGSRFLHAAVISGTQVFSCLQLLCSSPILCLGDRGKPHTCCFQKGGKGWKVQLPLSAGVLEYSVFDLVHGSPPGSGTCLCGFGASAWQTYSGQATDRWVGMGWGGVGWATFKRSG